MNPFPTVEAIDDRVRLAVGAGLGMVMVAMNSFPVLAVGSLQAVAVIMLARSHWPVCLKRLLLLNLFISVIVLTLPFGIPGQPLFTSGVPLNLAYSREGLLRAAVIAWKANLAFSLCWGLIGTLDPMRLGTALLDLKCPAKVVHLVFFSFRAVDELKTDLVCIRRAMQARGWTVGILSMRGIGYLLGNLLTRSFDTSERILRAMKSRGFVGGFPRLAVGTGLGLGDWAFVLAAAVPVTVVMIQGRWG